MCGDDEIQCDACATGECPVDCGQCKEGRFLKIPLSSLVRVAIFTNAMMTEEEFYICTEEDLSRLEKELAVKYGSDKIIVLSVAVDVDAKGKVEFIRAN